VVLLLLLLVLLLLLRISCVSVSFRSHVYFGISTHTNGRSHPDNATILLSRSLAVLAS
jgi:hypothetical protein